MSNFPTVQDVGNLQSALTTAPDKQVQTGGDFLKLDKNTGEWLVGADADIVTGDVIMVNTMSMRHGWVLWHMSVATKTYGSMLVPNSLPQPMESITYNTSKGEKTDAPAPARAVDAAFADDGTPVSYETNSGGGVECLDRLWNAMKAQALKSATHLFPKCELVVDFYKRADGDKVYKPVLKVIAWCDVDGNEEGVEPLPIEPPTEEAQAEEDVKDPPKQRRRTKPAPEAEEAEEPPFDTDEGEAEEPEAEEPEAEEPETQAAPTQQRRRRRRSES